MTTNKSYILAGIDSYALIRLIEGDFSLRSECDCRLIVDTILEHPKAADGTISTQRKRRLRVGTIANRNLREVNYSLHNFSEVFSLISDIQTPIRQLLEEAFLRMEALDH